MTTSTPAPSACSHCGDADADAASPCTALPQAPLCKAFDVVEAGEPPASRVGRKRLPVCHRDELPPGQRRLIQDGLLSIGVFNYEGKFYAVRNLCPHAAAPLCKGSLHGTHKPSDVGEFDPGYEGRILRCPWHGWEFDIVTGKGLYDERSRVTTYPVEVQDDGQIVVIR